MLPTLIPSQQKSSLSPHQQSSSMSSKQALAPSFYYIRTTESTPCDLVNPGTDNQQLYVTDQSTDVSHQVIWLSNTVTQILWALLFLQWLVTRNGIIRSMDVAGAGRFAYANLASSVVPQAILRSNLSIEWVIGVTPFVDYPFSYDLLADNVYLGYLGPMTSRVQSLPTIPPSIASPSMATTSVPFILVELSRAMYLYAGMGLCSSLGVVMNIEYSKK